jgi:hypothetical protein
VERSRFAPGIRLGYPATPGVHHACPEVFLEPPSGSRQDPGHKNKQTREPPPARRVLWSRPRAPDKILDEKWPGQGRVIKIRLRLGRISIPHPLCSSRILSGARGRLQQILRTGWYMFMQPVRVPSKWCCTERCRQIKFKVDQFGASKWLRGSIRKGGGRPPPHRS